jgi:hypothetical protein
MEPMCFNATIEVQKKRGMPRAIKGNFRVMLRQKLK